MVPRLDLWKRYPTINPNSCLQFSLLGFGSRASSKRVVIFYMSYERGCQEKKLLPAPRGDVGVVTYIQPHLILRGVLGLVALARRRF